MTSFVMAILISCTINISPTGGFLYVGTYTTGGGQHYSFIFDHMCPGSINI